MKSYRRFKKRHRIMHFGIMAFAIVLFWWALWNLLDMMVGWIDPIVMYPLGIVVALAVLYLDGLHLKELE